MKKLFFMALLGTAGYFSVSAQCDTKIKLVSDKAFEVKADNSEGQNIPVTAIIRFSKNSISVVLNYQNGTTTEISGANSSLVCKMNKGYTEGTIDIKSDAEIKTPETTGRSKMLITIESKAGQMKVYGVPEDNPDGKICFVIKEKQEIK